LTYKPAKKLYKTTILFIVVTIAGLVVIYFSNSLIIYFIIICILGIPHELTFPTSLTALSRSFPENDISAANTYFYSIMMFVAVLVPSIAGAIVYQVGLRLTFLLFAIPVAVIFILILYEYKINPEINN
jgi:DHA1 family multidrug resistance protein-like MFS transporter